MLQIPKKANVTSSAGKVIASVFWDAQGVVLHGLPPEGLYYPWLYYARAKSRKGGREYYTIHGYTTLEQSQEKEAGNDHGMCIVSTRPMLQSILQWLRWQLFGNAGSNLFRAHHIHQT